MTVGRIVRSADFQRVLAAPQRSRSPHFAVHYLPPTPQTGAVAENVQISTEVIHSLPTELSTTPVQGCEQAVDNSLRWLGLVVPKRLAKRAVTRNLLKRQVRAAMARHAAALPAGWWVVRLRAPFDRQTFLSPASDALRGCAHTEINALLERAAHTPLPAVPWVRRPKPGPRTR